MRVTPQANITDGTGTTIPAKTAAQARKVLSRTARLQGGPIIVKQHGYDPADPTAGATVSIDMDGRVTEREEPGLGPCWDVSYHSWMIDVDHEGTYNVPGLPTALGDAQMLATKHGKAVAVHVEDIKPDTTTDAHTLIEPQPEQPTDNGVNTARPDPGPDGQDAVAQSLAPQKERPATEPDDAADPRPAEDHESVQSTGPFPEYPNDTAIDQAAVGAGEDLFRGHFGDKDPPPLPSVLAKRRRRLLLTVLVALALLAAGAFVAVTTVLGSLAPDTSPSAAGPSPELWQTETIPGDHALAAHGVLVNTTPGKAEVFSLKDGKRRGGGELPEGPARVLSGAGSVFTVVTAPDGSNTGYVADAGGVKDFKAVKGTLVTRGSEPFLLTGTGKDQAALIWDGTNWKPVNAPEPGMAPVAATTTGILWLGTNGRLVQGTSSTGLQAPETAAKISAWVWASETSVALVWDTPKSRVLAVHTIIDGKLTGQVPVPDGDVRKDGDVLRTGTLAFTIHSGEPVAAACADPVPAGGQLWCNTDNTWAADNTRPLAPGHTPVPSPEDVVITATDTGFTAYPEDKKNDNN